MLARDALPTTVTLRPKAAPAGKTTPEATLAQGMITCPATDKLGGGAPSLVSAPANCRGLARSTARRTSHHLIRHDQGTSAFKPIDAQ